MAYTLDYQKTKGRRIDPRFSGLSDETTYRGFASIYRRCCGSSLTLTFLICGVQGQKLIKEKPEVICDLRIE